MVCCSQGQPTVQLCSRSSPGLAVGRIVQPCIRGSFLKVLKYISGLRKEWAKCESNFRSNKVISALHSSKAVLSGSLRRWQHKKQLLARKPATSGRGILCGKKRAGLTVIHSSSRWRTIILGRKLHEEKQP